MVLEAEGRQHCFLLFTNGGSGYVAMNSITVENTQVKALVGIGGRQAELVPLPQKVEGKPGGSTEFLGWGLAG